MTETGTVDGPPVANGATVSASALALHLDCSRTFIEGMIQRKGDGSALDKSRVAYLRYLRRERRQSSRTEADAEHAKAKATLLRIRITKEQRERPVSSRWQNRRSGILKRGLSGLRD